MSLLYERANQIPFDDQINHHAQLKDFNLMLIREFLSDIQSDLATNLGSISTTTLYRNMQIARGPEEHLLPINIGLLMFSEHPEAHFPYSQIEIVEFRDREGDSFSEKIFKGPIHKQLSEALRYIHSMYIREEIRKIPHQAEAQRFYNYPFTAIEEALANAIYHRSYQKREPIEVRIRPDCIEIQSFPGPLPPITIEELNLGRQIKVREYRNRRIGDFLKELRLTEGRCTGIPKIQRSLRKNGSSEAHFETDEERSYFLTTIPIHPLLHPSKSTQSEGLTTQSGPQLPKQLQEKIDNLKSRAQTHEIRSIIVELCAIRPYSAQELTQTLGRRDKKHLVRNHLVYLIQEGKLTMDNPHTTAANQKYRAISISSK